MASKGKILMLHGFVQSDRIFSNKTGGLRKNLKKLGYELYYPNGPELVDKSTLSGTKDSENPNQSISEGEKKELAAKFNTSIDSSDDLYGWWVRKTSGPQGLMDYEIKQSTFDYLHDYILENGPFDGIIGFSQGAGFGGYLAQDIHKILDLTKEQQPDLKFFISFSGFKLMPDSYLKPYEQDMAPPSLHVLGEMDAVVSEDRAMTLYNAWPVDKRTLLKHPGSHFIPNSKQFVVQVCNWIQVTTKKEADEEKHKQSIQPDKSSDSMGLDDDIMNMMDSIGK